MTMHPPGTRVVWIDPSPGNGRHPGVIVRVYPDEPAYLVEMDEPVGQELAGFTFGYCFTEELAFSEEDQ